MSAPGQTELAVELSELRGEIRTGLADIKGSLAVLVERTNRTDQDVRQLRADFEGELEKLRNDVEELKRNRWPLPAVGALTGVVGAVSGVLAFVLK